MSHIGCQSCDTQALQPNLSKGRLFATLDGFPAMPPTTKNTLSSLYNFGYSMMMGKMRLGGTSVEAAILLRCLTCYPHASPWWQRPGSWATTYLNFLGIGATTTTTNIDRRSTQPNVSTTWNTRIIIIYTLLYTAAQVSTSAYVCTCINVQSTHTFCKTA